MNKLDFILNKTAKKLNIDKKLASDLLDISKKCRKLIIVKIPPDMFSSQDMDILHHMFDPLCNEKVHFLILPDTIKFETHMLDDKTFRDTIRGVESERSPEYGISIRPPDSRVPF